MIQKFDLHMHSNRSDGQYSASELVQLIRTKNISCFSVTDHDNIDSISDIGNCDISGLKYIPGVEISSILDNKYRMHILGYYVNDNCPELLSILQQIRDSRIKRFYEVARLLDELFGIKLDKNELDKMIDEHSIPGRPHIAALMIEHGYCQTVREAFIEYMRKVRVKIPYRVDACEAISAIKKSGGTAVWAHPKTTEKTHDIMADDIVARMIGAGIQGIEVYNSIHTLDESARYLNMAENNGLLVSGGSDFHGEKVKDNVEMGVIYRDKKNVEINVSDMTVIK